MDLAQARTAKAAMLRQIALGRFAQRERGAAVTAASAVAPARTVAVGFRLTESNAYQIALRLSDPADRESDAVRAALDTAPGGPDRVDVRVVGEIQALTTNPPAADDADDAGEASRMQQRRRPLAIGQSIGHAGEVAAGTLGVFVERVEGGGRPMLLSNCHVIAQNGFAATGDAIHQPSRLDRPDQRADDADRVAGLTLAAPLAVGVSDDADAAIAELDEEIPYDPTTLAGLGILRGVGDEFMEVRRRVAKVGRTTGLTFGRVTAFELDGVSVAGYAGHQPGGVLVFDGCLEFETDQADQPFSRPGDSGSLIVTRNDLRAVGLLFAGGTQGGAGDQGYTYAHPIRTAFDALGVGLRLK